MRGDVGACSLNYCLEGAIIKDRLSLQSKIIESGNLLFHFNMYVCGWGGVSVVVCVWVCGCVCIHIYMYVSNQVKNVEEMTTSLAS